MLDYKKIYYYVVALIAFFVLLWGGIDFGSAALSYLFNQGVQKESQPLDDYYSKKMGQERLGDSLVRMIVAGGVFYYSRKKIDELEGGKNVS